jgi:hypothetical protein
VCVDCRYPWDRPAGAIKERRPTIAIRMATSPCLWRTQVGRFVQHDRCPQDAAGAPLEQPRKLARMHGVRALGGNGRQPTALPPCSRMSITLSPTVTHLQCKRGSRFNRTRKGSSAARCVVEEVRNPTEDNGLCRRLLEPEAAGITTSGVGDRDTTCAKCLCNDALFSATCSRVVIRSLCSEVLNLPPLEPQMRCRCIQVSPPHILVMLSCPVTDLLSLMWGFVCRRCLASRTRTLRER